MKIVLFKDNRPVTRAQAETSEGILETLDKILKDAKLNLLQIGNFTVECQERSSLTSCRIATIIVEVFRLTKKFL